MFPDLDPGPQRAAASPGKVLASMRLCASGCFLFLGLASLESFQKTIVSLVTV